MEGHTYSNKLSLWIRPQTVEGDNSEMEKGRWITGCGGGGGGGGFSKWLSGKSIVPTSLIRRHVIKLRCVK